MVARGHPPPGPPGRILIGTCNWADHEGFYPSHLLRGDAQREKLSFYARHLPLVEVDTTFYGVPSPAIAAGWAERTPMSFRFNVKAHRSLTGHEREGGRPRRATSEEERSFLDLLTPLREAGKLVAVHYQLPPWVTNVPASRRLLLEARERHPNDIVAIELRHRSWFDGDAWAATEELLAELDVTFVGVDAPQVGSGTAPPLLAVTSRRLCIARFHGRNRAAWYRGGPRSADRFDHLYTPDELAEWVPPIRAAAADGVPVHVLMNNNRSNYAVANAFDMGALLGERLPRPPEPVLATLARRDGRTPSWVPGADAAGSDGVQLGLAL